MKRTKEIIYLIYICYVLILCFFLNFVQIDYKDWLNLIEKFIYISFAIQIVILMTLEVKLLSIRFVFLFFSYIFLLSYPLLLKYDYNFGMMTTSISTTIYGEIIFQKAINISLVTILFIVVGYIFQKYFDFSIVIFKSKNIIVHSKIKIMAYILTILTGVVDLIILIKRYHLMKEGGYVKVAFYEINYLLLILTYIFPIGIILILYIYKDSKKRKIITALFIIYKLLGILTGLRAYTIVQLLVFFIYYDIYIEKIRKKIYIILSILLYFVLCLFRIVRLERASGLSLSSFMNVKDYLLGFDILLNSMSEYGITINVVCRVVQSNVYIIGEGGKQILISLLSPIPLISKIIPEFFQRNIYAALDLYRIGGSYVGDFYYDFGNLYFILAIIYGYLIAKLDKIMLVNYKNITKSVFYYPFIVEVIFSVRSGTFKILRVLVWSYTIILLIYIALKIIIPRWRR